MMCLPEMPKGFLVSVSRSLDELGLAVSHPKPPSVAIVRPKYDKRFRKKQFCPKIKYTHAYRQHACTKTLFLSCNLAYLLLKILEELIESDLHSAFYNHIRSGRNLP